MPFQPKVKNMMDVSNFAEHFTTESFDALALGASHASDAGKDPGAHLSSAAPQARNCSHGVQTPAAAHQGNDFQDFQYVAPVAKVIASSCGAPASGVEAGASVGGGAGRAGNGGVRGQGEAGKFSSRGGDDGAVGEGGDAEAMRNEEDRPVLATEFLLLCRWDTERAVQAICAAMFNREELEAESLTQSEGVAHSVDRHHFALQKLRDFKVALDKKASVLASGGSHRHRSYSGWASFSASDRGSAHGSTASDDAFAHF